MNDVENIGKVNSSSGDTTSAQEVARLIWDDAEEVDAIVDPRTSDFATEVIGFCRKVLCWP